MVRDVAANQLFGYLNGFLIGATALTSSSAGYIPATDVSIGSRHLVAQWFGGRIDEVRIYPYALSAAQITQLYTDGNAGLGSPTVIQSEETVVGQLWDLSVTPVTLSGAVGSATASSNPVVIVSGAPTITGSLDNPDEGSPITSSLSVPVGSIAGYRWVKNNANLMALNIPFNSGATQSDVSGAGNHGTTINAPTFTFWRKSATADFVGGRPY